MEKHYKNQVLIDKLRGRIFKIRKDKKITQEDLVKLTGFDIRQIGRIERGETNPTISSIEAIATALGVEMIDLFNFKLEEGEKFTLKT
ncbi:helix-turn-helix domain-containing protein [Mucilaginibacter ginsenosidivorax]|uniref:Helix-turn-helix transcriptional regulator n=1 Tax=Mucilaginibacter ginsenosidivorax TaxID=862126 RepID=A0A5B8VWQ1_9SPHI|nr:helix-turn-helix transcriptional regulator [Mucilaginibacter ginsenosidivorax]QEC74668.1 helix-turn-helix transcriptional regulator [Mucilaginibacter ginsenosidivorax]